MQLILYKFSLSNTPNNYVSLEGKKLPRVAGPAEHQPPDGEALLDPEEWRFTAITLDKEAGATLMLSEQNLMAHFKRPNIACCEPCIGDRLPLKLNTELKCVDETPQRGWGLIVHMQWDWATFLIWWGWILTIGWVLDGALCWHFKCGISLGLSIGTGMLAITGAIITCIWLVGKQKKPIEGLPPIQVNPIT
jgi:hypothetical protein